MPVCSRCAWSATLLAGLGAFAATPSPAAVAPPAPPAALEAYAADPSLELAVLSPGGSRIAYVRNVPGGERVLMVQTPPAVAPTFAVRLGRVDVDLLLWADEQTLIARTPFVRAYSGSGADMRTWYELQVCSVATRSCRDATPGNRRNDGLVNTVWGPLQIREVGGRLQLYTGGVQTAGRTWTPVLTRLDLDTLAWSIAVVGDDATVGWLVDDRGDVAADLRWTVGDGRWSARLRREGELVEVASGVSADGAPWFPGFGPDGSSPIIEIPADGARTWKLVSASAGLVDSPYPESATRGYAIVDSRTQRISGRGDDFALRYRFDDAEWQRRWDSLVRAFGGAAVEWIDSSRNFERVVVRAFGNGAAPEYHLFDWPSRSASLIAPAHPGIEAAGELRRLHYRARDGLELEAFLTLPPGRDPRGLPLVVLAYNDYTSWDARHRFEWLPQALASRGYAVVRPVVRGSTTASPEVLRAGFGELGRAMRTDRADVVRHLANEGIVDPDRVCIAGIFAGGFAALASATFDAGAFRCAIAVNGISNLRVYLRWLFGERRLPEAAGHWLRYAGAASVDDPHLLAISPVTAAADTRGPTLLLHTREAKAIPSFHSTSMAEALARHGKTVELRLLPEDQGLVRPDTRLEVLRYALDFLQRHNPP